MNRRVIAFAAFLMLGLMFGILIGRFFMPDRYGLLTMILLVAGGMVTGALLLGVGIQTGRTYARQTQGEGEGTASSPEPLRWAFALGTRNIVVRTDPQWGERFRARWLGSDAERAKGWRGLWDARWNAVSIPAAPVVLGALGLAILAQLLIIGQLLVPGLVVYAAAGALLVFWMWRHKISLFEVTRAAQIGRRVEIVFLIVILLIALGARVIEAGNLPRGIDGDELKWTAQVYYDFVAKQNMGDFAGQQKYTPVSFYVDKIAFDIFGVDFNSPRVMTALLSVLATLVFYFIARDMFNPFVALIATLFMATSYYDVNTSRQAIVQTFTKLPMLLAVWLLLRGIDKQRWFYFLLCGFVMYLGILTYDTFFVVPPALLLYLAFRGVLNWKKWYRWLLYVALVIAPMLLAYPIVAETVRGRQYTYVKGVSTGISTVVSQNSLAPMVENAERAFTVLFRALQGSDYALNWDGPLLNPLVLILFVLGFALVLSRFWQRHNLLLILLFVIGFFPAPILSGYTVPRVFYIGLPPIFIFASVFVAVLTTTLLSMAKTRVVFARAVTVALLVALAIVAVSDGWIFSQQLKQQADWLKRRYLVNTIKSSVQNAPLTLLPVTRTPDDFIWGNEAVLKFIAFTATKDDKAERRYKIIAFDELPGLLGTLNGNYDSVSILYDKDLGKTNARARATMETLKRCYANVKTRTGSFFDTYVLDRRALESPNCYSLTDLRGIAPAPDEPVAAKQPLTFTWEADSNRPTAYRVEIQQRNPNLVWVEGEDFSDENGWMYEAKSEHYPPFSGTGYILDKERSTPNAMMVHILTDGTYQVWVRSLRGGKEGHRNFVSVNDQKFEFARAEQVPYMDWNWENVGSVDLTTGETTLALSREYSDLGWKPVLIDALFLSADPDYDPNASELWTTMQDTGQVNSKETQFVLEQGLDPGLYRWRVQLLDGAKLVDADGKKGSWSEMLEFQVW